MREVCSVTSAAATHASDLDRPMPFTVLRKKFPGPLRPRCHGLGGSEMGETRGKR